MAITKRGSIVLGVNRTQDASICLLSENGVICAIQKERLTRKKHHWGGLDDLRSIYLDYLPCLRKPIDLVVECYSSDPQIRNLEYYREELRDVLSFPAEPRFELVSHHLAHLYSVFHTSGFESAAVMVIDSVGSPSSHILEAWPSKLGVPDHHVEVASYYVATHDAIRCLEKQLWDLNRQRPVGLGFFYHLLTQTIFPGAGNEGKVMGLAAYASGSELKLPNLIVSNGHVQIPDEWLSVFADRQKYAYVETRDGHLSDCAKLAAAGQRVFEDAIVEIATWLQSVTQCENLCFAGGTALNCVANTRIRLETGFHDVFIPPAPHDGGTALGCAVYGMKEILKSPSQFRWSSDYLGAEPTYASELSALNSQFPDLVVNEPKMLVRDVARIIANGEIVALFQGRSESGPRALGHRSILADPRRREMRDWINKTIKGREMFRPLAPAVLIADVSAYFELQHSSPFMLYSTATRSDKRALIPAVVHVDGSARVQTVSEDDDPFLFKLLTSFRELTGIPVLLNTSFNSKNEPIVESINDAITCFVKFPIHRLVCPPFIITKKILPPVLREKVETEEHVH